MALPSHSQMPTLIKDINANDIKITFLPSAQANVATIELHDANEVVGEHILSYCVFDETLEVTGLRMEKPKEGTTNRNLILFLVAYEGFSPYTAFAKAVCKVFPSNKEYFKHLLGEY